MKVRFYSRTNQLAIEKTAEREESSILWNWPRQLRKPQNFYETLSIFGEVATTSSKKWEYTQIWEIICSAFICFKPSPANYNKVAEFFLSRLSSKLREFFCQRRLKAVILYFNITIQIFLSLVFLCIRIHWMKHNSWWCRLFHYLYSTLWSP